LTTLDLNRKSAHDRQILGKHAKRRLETSKQATELILDLSTCHSNLTATILGRAHTGRKDGYTLGEIQGEAIRPLELYGQCRTPIGKC
jgi:hypothetical protein